MILGVIFSAIIALVAIYLSSLEFIKNTVNFSPLIVAIIIGLILANLIKIPEILKPGINFSLKKILRVAIILLGFRLTFQNIVDVGVEGLLVDAFMLVSSFIFGVWISQRFFRLEP